MLVTRGLGRRATEDSLLASYGFGRNASAARGAGWRDRPPVPWSWEYDDADLLEIVPAIIGVLNAKQRH